MRRVDVHLRCLPEQVHVHAGGPGVSSHVVQGLLSDAVERFGHCCRQQRVVALHLQVDQEVFPCAEEQRVIVQRGGQPLLAQWGGAQVFDEPGHLPLGGLGRRLHLAHHLGQVVRHIWQRVEAGADAAGCHGQAEEVLLDAVVQLAGQPIALFDHGQGAHLIGESGVAFAQRVQILLVLFEVLGQQV